MTLKEQLNADLRDAMRAGDETTKSTLRLLLTAIHNAEIPPESKDAAAEAPASPLRDDLDDAAVLDIVRREVKQRRDSIEAYTKASRGDLAAREEAEVAVLQKYLPAQMSRDEIAAVAREVIAELGVSGPQAKGRVMPAVIGRLKDRAEGREINAVVTELLSGF
jgi:uncharacterized protein YqeY